MGIPGSTATPEIDPWLKTRRDQVRSTDFPHR
jgi:hypothetical protein